MFKLGYQQLMINKVRISFAEGKYPAGTLRKMTSYCRRWVLVG